MSREQKMLAVVAAARSAIAEWDVDGEMDVSPMRQALAALDTPDAEAGETVTLAVWEYPDGDTEFCKVGSVTDGRAGKWTRLGTVTLPLVKERGA